ncbi:LRP16 family protein [Kwoniella heveanensis CBS 569]|nr:LRP16 family protein [Kwoniella heveanensis CBS 569]
MTGSYPTTVQEIPTLSDLYSNGQISEPDAKWRPGKQYRHAEDLNKRISIWRDMIVNAANSSLLGGGGVDGAIHRAAGSDLLRECETLGGAETGETKVTKGYKLPARWVAHTVGPIYNSSRAERNAKQLESCYYTSLAHCAGRGGGSIGFSSISTGVYGYPIKDATAIALETTRNFLEKDKSVTRVIYVVFSARDEDVYKSLVGHYFPAPPSASNFDPGSSSGGAAGGAARGQE